MRRLGVASFDWSEEKELEEWRQGNYADLRDAFMGGKMSLRELAEWRGVSYRTLRNLAGKEKWHAQRREQNGRRGRIARAKEETLQTIKAAQQALQQYASKEGAKPAEIARAASALCRLLRFASS